MGARRRLASMADLFLRQHLQRRAFDYENEQIGTRQQDLARLNQQSDTEQQLLNKAFADPTGRVIEQLLKSGQTSLAGIDLSALRPTGANALANTSSSIDKANTVEQLPSVRGVINDFANQPGREDIEAAPTEFGEDGLAIPHMSNIQSLLNQRQDRIGQIQGAAMPVDKSFVDEQGIESSVSVNPFADQGIVRPTERTGAQEGARLGETAIGAVPGQITAGNQLESGLRSGKVRTASAMAQAQEAARTAGELQRLQMVRAQAANDPVIASAAENVIANPENLKLVPAKDRTFVMAALQSDKYKSQTKKSTEQILNTAWDALAQLESMPEGIEGMVGNRIMDPSRWLYGTGESPFGGSDAANARTVFDQLKAALTLPKLEYLKGLGHMSDMEFGTVAKAATALSSNTDEAFFMSQLPVVKEGLRAAYKKAGLPEPGPSALTGGAPTPAQQKLQQFRNQ